MNKSVAFLILAFSLSACSASGPLYKSEAKLQDKATVYVYRPFQYFNAGGWPEIFVDGSKLFPLKNEGYGVINLEPGSHTVKAEGSMLFTNWYPGPMEITYVFEANNEYYLRVTPEMTSMTPIGNSVVIQGKGSIFLMPEEAAKREIATTKKVN